MSIFGVPFISEDGQGWIYRPGVDDCAPVLRTGCALEYEGAWHWPVALGTGRAVGADWVLGNGCTSETYGTMVVQVGGRPTAVGAWHWPGALGTVCAVGMYRTMHVH
jgi:hypothetical protein